VKAHRVYIEGADSKEDKIRAREAFRKLLEDAGFGKDERMPRTIACGGRNATFDDFKTAHANSGPDDYVGMLVDSEEPLADLEKTWQHLKKRDNWDKPPGAVDEQVLFMTTCMETWIVADRESLREHYGHKLQENALPSLVNLEQRDRHDVQKQLAHATRDCSNAYSKGRRSYQVLAVLRATVLKSLPSFARTVRILKDRL
jgi:hypothetical protein